VLTTTERTELESKNCNHIETIGSNTFMYNGLTAGGEEKRIMLARDWFVARIREGIFTDQLNQPLSAFDNPTLSRVEQDQRGGRRSDCAGYPARHG
jgi:hypothetical protein